MKSTRMCISGSALAVVLGGFLSLSFGLCSIESDKAEPTGTNVGDIVQFDAIVELNRYSPRSLRHDYTLIFARYWVARDSYSISVVWAEPQSTDLFFAAHPAGLSIASDEHEFKICDEAIKKSTVSYKKPVGERGVFRHKFGSYPIGNIRFAEGEALAERVYAADLAKFKDDEQCLGKAVDIPILPATGENVRDVARLKLHCYGQRIDSIQMFNAEQRLLKTISYEYGSNVGKPYLRKQKVVLHERPMMVGFNGDGMKVTLDGKEYWYRDIQVKHHSGGRTCTVEYEVVRLGEKELPFPVKVTVCNEKDGRILRRVRMMNFKQVHLDTARAEEAARQFGAITADQRQYEAFRHKYWKKAPIDIEKDDIVAIEQLRARFVDALAAAENSIGHKLKLLSILMELNMMLGDNSELEGCYRTYLSTLTENKLLGMTLVGGYGVIETTMFQSRRSEAGKLMGRWVDAALETNDDASILLFAKRQLAKNRLWTTAVLLETFSNKRLCPLEVRFEAQVLRCSALYGLCKILCIDDIAEKGLIAKVQADWVSSIGKDSLEKMLGDLMAKAKRSFAEFNEPTESQKILKKKLDKIDKEIKQASEFSPAR